ncbi:MAG: DinB family protein, partial [Longimicrobiales bacterium]
MEYSSGAEFLKYFENIRARTGRVIECIPRDRIDWRPAAAAFSFADLIRHLAATERFMFGENAQCQASRYPGHGPELADGYEAVMSYFQAKHAETAGIIGALTAQDL